MSRPIPQSAGMARRNSHSDQARQLAQDSDPLAVLGQIVPEDVPERSTLAEHVRRAHALCGEHRQRATVAAAIAGRFLLEVQHRLEGTGESFTQWCALEGLPRRTAYNYIAVAQRVAEDPALIDQPVREVLGYAAQVALPRAKIAVDTLERFRALAEDRGMKPAELLALVVDDWIARNDGVIDV
jgi:hypothetical protein